MSGAHKPPQTDAWGIQRWFSMCQRVSPMPDTASDEKKQLGKWVYRGKIVDYWARRIADAAGWKPEWRGDWSPVLDWIDLDLPLRDVCVEVGRSAASYRSKRNPAVSLRAFDHSIRNRKAAA
jgi:hypothetical protein